MLQHQSTIGGAKTVVRILAGTFTAAILLVCLVVSQHAFAEQSPESLEAAVSDLPKSETVPSDPSEPADVPNEISENTSKEESWKAVRMRVTAYCPCSHCCGEFADGITACNHRIVDGDRFVAADKTYSFGTEMIIPGYNQGQPVEVKDRGGAIKDNKLDVFFNTHQEALEWGVQHLYVLVKVQ